MNISRAQDDQNFPLVDHAPIVTAQKVDGKLDEDDWQNGKVVTEPFKMEPQQERRYLYNTQVKLLRMSKTFM